MKIKQKTHPGDALSGESVFKCLLILYGNTTAGCSCGKHGAAVANTALYPIPFELTRKVPKFGVDAHAPQIKIKVFNKRKPNPDTSSAGSKFDILIKCQKVTGNTTTAGISRNFCGYAVQPNAAA
jgi:hypothetical protein